MTMVKTASFESPIEWPRKTRRAGTLSCLTANRTMDDVLEISKIATEHGYIVID